MGGNFKKKRKSLGYSIEELAKISGISESTIKNIENEKRIPRKVTFELLIKALNLEIKYEDYYKFLQEKKRRKEKENDNIEEDLNDKLHKIKGLYMDGRFGCILKTVEEFIPLEEIKNYFYKEEKDERKVGKFNTN